jgi:hypothetical protein
MQLRRRSRVRACADYKISRQIAPNGSSENCVPKQFEQTTLHPRDSRWYNLITDYTFNTACKCKRLHQVQINRLLLPTAGLKQLMGPQLSLKSSRGRKKEGRKGES